jgi:hypothetical protein
MALDGNGSGIWSHIIESTDATMVPLTRPVQGLMAYGGDSAFVLGGVETSATTPSTESLKAMITLSGLVQYNMTTRTFSNYSATSYSHNGAAERGALQYVPVFGSSGLYIAMGGDESALGPYIPGHSLQSFDKLNIYDPSTRDWYQQTTTGTPPDPRIQFCATGQASQNNTYEMYVLKLTNDKLVQLLTVYIDSYTQVGVRTWGLKPYRLIHCIFLRSPLFTGYRLAILPPIRVMVSAAKPSEAR